MKTITRALLLSILAVATACGGADAPDDTASRDFAASPAGMEGVQGVAGSNPAVPTGLRSSPASV
jgi:hypothetical protein